MTAQGIRTAGAWVLCCAVVFPAVTVVAAISQDEREALIALYLSTGGDHWTDSSSWRKSGTGGFNDPGTECTWFGVTCDVGETTVTSLTLHNNNLVGTLSAEIGGLTGLEVLGLATNSLSGPIPVEIKYLSNLQLLRIHTNQLSGPIPPEIADLENLNRLEISNNQLSGQIPPEIGGMTGLSVLYADGNRLSGVIPPEIGGLSWLAQLSLHHNLLSGSIPPEIGNLSSLDHLQLQDNQLSGAIPPEIGSLSDLEILRLSRNHLSGAIPSEIGDLTSVGILGLQANRLSGEIPAELANLTALASGGLDLRWNALYSDDPALVAFLSSKQYLNDWQSTQTVAPEGVVVTAMGDHTVWLEWSMVSYIADDGGYQVLSEEVPGGPTVSGGFTWTKLVTFFPVTALAAGHSYDLSVGSYTEPHYINQNTVTSEPSAPTMVTTSDLGCVAPAVMITHLGGSSTLTVTTTHDALQWSTGATTQSISIDPSQRKCYWVRATGPGWCDESAVVCFPGIFADGFETGSLARWSSSVGAGS